MVFYLLILISPIHSAAEIGSLNIVTNLLINHSNINDEDEEYFFEMN